MFTNSRPGASVLLRLTIATEETTEGEVEPLLETEEAEGGARTVAKLGDGRRFQGAAVDGGPHAANFLQSITAVSG